PAFALGQRPGLLDAHAVADIRLVFIVVREKFAVGGHDLLELRMTEPPLDPDHDGLVHFVGNDSSDKFLTMATMEVCFRHSGLRQSRGAVGKFGSRSARCRGANRAVAPAFPTGRWPAAAAD